MPYSIRLAPHQRSRVFLSLTLLAGAALGAIPACSASDGSNKVQGGGGGATSGSGGSGGSIIGVPGTGGATVDVVIGTCTTDCQDFPAEPLSDPESPTPVSDAEKAMFGPPDTFSDGTLCVLEPVLGQNGQNGALFPANWTRPRFRWAPAIGDTAFEVRLSAENQANDLVAYTRNTSYKIPKDVWEKVAQNTHTPISVTIRGVGGGGVSGSRGTFTIAPVNATGSMVFWATNTKKITKDGSFLLSFAVGSETVARALTQPDVAQQTFDGTSHEQQGMTWEDGQSLRDVSQYEPVNKPGYQPGEIACIGCHTSTPDGDVVLFGDDWPWAKVAANVDPEVGPVGAAPSWLTPAGQALLRVPFQSTPTMSPAHWSAGQRMMVTSWANLDGGELYSKSGISDQGTWNNGGRLVWVNLASDAAIDPYRGSDPAGAKQARAAAILGAKGTAWDYLTTANETFDSLVTPDWSHDGSRVAYTATTFADNGHPSQSNPSVAADIHVVPYNNGDGGDVVPLAGASDPVAKEYYPAFSQDDRFIAFNRAASGAPYYNSGSEVFVVDAQGGAPMRLSANDPPACSGQVSPGVTNSWAKWSPSVVSADGKTYYFLVFSSTRAHEGQFDLTDPWNPSAAPQKSAQLYMAAVVVDDATGSITDYPAVYLWNQNNQVVGDMLQPQMSSNLTPAWDTFKIPPPPDITIQ